MRKKYTRARSRRTVQRVCVLRYLSMITAFTRTIKGQKSCILCKMEIIKVTGQTDIRVVVSSPCFAAKKTESLPNSAFTFQRVRCDSRMKRKYTKYRKLRILDVREEFMVGMLRKLPLKFYFDQIISSLVFPLSLSLNVNLREFQIHDRILYST